MRLRHVKAADLETVAVAAPRPTRGRSWVASEPGIPGTIGDMFPALARLVTEPVITPESDDDYWAARIYDPAHRAHVAR